MTTFELTPEHVQLLRHAYVGWQDCETGAPEIDPKRPYGNSYVAGDVWELLHGHAEHELNDEEIGVMLDLHQQTEQALQVVLATGSFEPGVYEGPRWGVGPGWRRVSGPAADEATATPAVATAEPADWTAGPDGRSNSYLFETLVDVVERAIRNSAHLLISGEVRAVAAAVVAELAHEHGLRPAAPKETQ